MFYLSLLAAFCLLLVLVPAEYYNLPARLTVTLIFYFLCLLGGHITRQDALQHRAQVGTEVVKPIDFGGDGSTYTRPVYDESSTWQFITLGMPVLAVVLLRFFNRRTRLHPFLAFGFPFYLWVISSLPAWFKY